MTQIYKEDKGCILILSFRVFSCDACNKLQINDFLLLVHRKGVS